MSFQHFRLHPIASQVHTQVVNPPLPSVSPSSLSQALGQHPPASPSQIQPQSVHQQPVQQQGPSSASKKGPYGSGDADDGYTLVFESMAAFQEWRRKEEEEKMVEFVKGDTHGSKAVPPRFKDHTKLVCARHSRSGRKKYVKKFPDRVRKVPSRKLDGQGCSASISYKTYFDTDMVRACYVSEHSHEIGIANLPYTKRGRKAQAEQQQARAKSRNRAAAHDSSDSSSNPSSAHPSAQNLAGPSSMTSQHGYQSAAPSLGSASQAGPSQTFQSAISMLAPLPQGQPPPSLQPQGQVDFSQDRWDRMGVLFQSIRDHARNYEYPSPSVAALESVLIRLYLESPMGNPVAPTPPQPNQMTGYLPRNDGVQHMNGTNGSGV